MKTKSIALLLICLLIASVANSSGKHNHTLIYGLADTGLLVDQAFTFKSQHHGFNSTRLVDQAQFQYEQNGVRIHIQYFEYPSETIPAITVLKESALSQLSKLSNIKMLNYKVTDESTREIKSNTINASMQMPYFNKEIKYIVRNIVSGNQRWLINATYKDCDQNGQRLTEKFLNDLRINKNA